MFIFYMTGVQFNYARQEKKKENPFENSRLIDVYYLANFLLSLPRHRLDTI